MNDFFTQLGTPRKRNEFFIYGYHFCHSLVNSLKNYSQNAWNNYSASPEATYMFKNKKASGCKIAKDRITVLCCASMTSVREPLLVIGKSANPQCFKSVKDLLVQYTSNEKAWVTMMIFNDWLNKGDQRLKRNVLLLVENCTPRTLPCHISACEHHILTTASRSRHNQDHKSLL